LHDQPTAGSPVDEDLQDEAVVLIHVVKAQPTTLRLSDLIRELGDPEDFAKRDRIERAVRELVRTGLLFRCEGAVLPTRPAIRAYEVLSR